MSEIWVLGAQNSGFWGVPPPWVGWVYP